MLLHFAWHESLRHESWNEKYHWIEFAGLDAELQETFADWAVTVAGGSHDAPIPYSVIFARGKNFDAAGRYILRNDGSGLTCATFLLALFEDYELPLVLPDTWPISRSGDFRWVRKILGLLRERISLPHFLEQVRQRHALKRYRPEEVLATAALFVGHPLDFVTVAPEGERLLRLVPN